MTPYNAITNAITILPILAVCYRLISICHHIIDYKQKNKKQKGKRRSNDNNDEPKNTFVFKMSYEQSSKMYK